MKKTTANYDWINTPPTVVEQNIDGSEFIPIGHVEAGLTKLDTHWGTENFKFRLFMGKSGRMFADGSIDLIVTYGGRQRRLVGAATMLIPADTDFSDPYVNCNFGAVIKSECIKNSSKGIGTFFGAALNDRLNINTPQANTRLNGRKKPDSVKIKPDAKMQLQFNNAYDSGAMGLVKALEDIYEITYTGLIGNAKTNVNAQS